MNYLAHLHLGGHRPAQLLGSLYGDFVKGPLSGRFPAELEAAIRLHRSIDAFTDSHPLIKASIARFPSQRRRYAGIMLDVFFDHCLARDWHCYADLPLDVFTGKVYGTLAAEPQLPERLALIAPRMAAHGRAGLAGFVSEFRRAGASAERDIATLVTARRAGRRHAGTAGALPALECGFRRVLSAIGGFCSGCPGRARSHFARLSRLAGYLFTDH